MLSCTEHDSRYLRDVRHVAYVVMTCVVDICSREVVTFLVVCLYICISFI